MEFKIKKPLKQVHSLPNIWRQAMALKIPFERPVEVQKISFFFFLVAIFFIPFDSFPIFPVSSVYRPVSVLFLLVPFFLILYRGKLRSSDVMVLFVTLLVLIHSFYLSVVLFGVYEQLPKVMITALLSAIIIIVLAHQFEEAENKEKFLARISAVIFFSLFFVSMIGALQLLSKLGLAPKSLTRSITLLFSYRTTDRIQMVSGEPSMLVRNLMFCWPFIYFYYKGRYRKLALAIIVIFLLLSGSTYGYLILMFFVAAYMVLFRFSLRNVLAIVVLGAFMGGFLFYAYQNFLDNYTRQKLEKVVAVAQDPRALQVVVSVDGSIFQRVINPTIGFMSGDYNYFMGVGLDNYRHIYPEYIMEHFPYAMSYETVKAAVDGVQYITPKSLYSKIYSELGILPFVVFLGYLAYVYYRIRKLNRETKLYKFLAFCFSLSVVFVLNMDSIIYVNFLFLAVLVPILLNDERKRRRISG